MIRLNRGCGLIYPELECAPLWSGTVTWEAPGDQREELRAEGRKSSHREWEHHSSVALQQRETAAT